MAFDPCREWLGIDAVDLGDPGRVLGLQPGCRDPMIIGRAADARLQALQQVAPGAFARAHAALVARVEESRDTLLAAVFAGGMSAQAGHQQPMFAPPPGLPPSAAPGRSSGEDSPRRAASRFPTADDDAGPVLQTAPSLTVRRSAPRGRSSSAGAGGLLLASFALLAAAVAVLLFLMLRPRSDAVPDLAAGQVAVNKPAATPPASGGSPTREGGAGGLDRDEQDGPRRQQTEMQKQDAEQRRRDEQELASREAKADAEADANAEADATADAEAEAKTNTEAKGAMVEHDAAAAAQKTEKPRDPAPTAATEGTEGDQDRARMQEALDKSLREAFTALQRGEFDTADRVIAAAGGDVGDDVEAATRLERWRILATYAKEYTKFRDQAFAAANAGRDYQIDGKPFATIEITPDTFTYRWDGENKRVARDQVPPRIELAVVAGWFEGDGRAANHLFLGARWLSLDPPNPAQARAEWRIAENGGKQVDALNALLNDPVILRAGR